MTASIEGFDAQDFTQYRVRIAAYAVVVDDQGRMLLSWYNGSSRGEPCWTLPGGGVDFDESPEQGVVREVHEETGLDVELGQLLFTDTSWWGEHEWPTGEPAKSLRLVYLARVTGGVLGTLEQDGTTDRAEWVDVANLPDGTPIASTLRRVLEVLGVTG